MTQNVRTGLCVVVQVAIAIGAPPVRADPPLVRLDYEKGALAGDCPDESELREGVAARLGYDPFSDEATVTMAVRIDRRDALWIGELQLTEGGQVLGEHRTEAGGRTCRGLVAALEVAVAIALDPVNFVQEAAAEEQDEEAEGHLVSTRLEAAGAMS